MNCQTKEFRIIPLKKFSELKEQDMTEVQQKKGNY